MHVSGKRAYMLRATGRFRVEPKFLSLGAKSVLRGFMVFDRTGTSNSGKRRISCDERAPLDQLF